MIDFLAIFLSISGLIIGLGATTVVDVHGFLARKSSYWTETTIRVHKVTKPLIWVGIAFLCMGSMLYYRADFLKGGWIMQMGIIFVLILNGCFLSFVVSPELLRREKSGRAKELFPMSLQKKVILSLFLSFMGWWSTVVLFSLSFLTH